MVNKREKTRSLVYQMKEDIFRHEAALRELEDKESATEQVSKTKFVPLPEFCHHSSGTVYDHPEGILRMALLFEERAQMLDRKSLSSLSLQKTSTPLYAKTYLAADVSPTRSRRKRQSTRSVQAEPDVLTLSPTASRSPIQQLFRDKMEGLESGNWAVGSFEVKTDLTSDDASETLAVLGVSLENKGGTDAFSPPFSPTSNGLVKTLHAVENQEESNSASPVHYIERNRSGVEETDNLQRIEKVSDTTVVTAAGSHVNDTSAVASSSDKVCAPAEGGHISTDLVDTEKPESVKVEGMKSASRLTRKRHTDSAERNLLTESSASDNTDTAPQIQTRRRLSKDMMDADKVKDVTEEKLESQRLDLSKSARKKLHTEPLHDISDNELKQSQSTESKSVNRKRTAGSSRSSLPSNKKSRDGNAVNVQRALRSKDSGVLQEESLVVEKHKDISGKEQIIPQDTASSSNCNTQAESVSQKIEVSNVEASCLESTKFTSHKPSDSVVTSDQPYSHMDNRRLLEVNSSTVNNDESQCLQSVKSEASCSNELMTVEVKPADDVTSLRDTKMVNLENSSILKPVNSPSHRGSGNLIDDDLDTFCSKSRTSEPENIKKRVSASRSGLKAHRGICDTEASKKLGDETGKDSVAKEECVKKKYMSQSRRRASRIAKNAASVQENSEFRTTNQAENDDNIIRHKTVNCEEDTLCHLSSSAVSSELSVSAKSESPLTPRTSDSRVQLTSSLSADDFSVDVSVSSPTNQGRRDVVDATNMDSGLRSAVNDSHMSSSSLVSNTDKRNIHVNNIYNPVIGLQNDCTGAKSRSEGGWKSGLSDVFVSQLSDLARKTTASSRKRAAQIMAGCRPRTVSVKKAPQMIIDTDQRTTVENRDQQAVSEHMSSDRTNLDIYGSADEKRRQPFTPKRVPFTPADFAVSASVGTLAESSNHFVGVTSVEVDARYTLQSNFQKSVNDKQEINRQTPCHPPSVVNDSYQRGDKSNFFNGPQFLKNDSVDSKFSGFPLGSRETKSLASSTVSMDSKDSKRAAMRAELLRKFVPSQLVLSDSIKRRVQDGLQLLSSIRSAPTICSHTRQKLMEYLNQSHRDTAQERLPLRPIEDKLDPDKCDASVQRRLPARPRRSRVYSEWDYVSGDEYTSPVSDIESHSDSDYSVDLEDLAASDADVKSESAVRCRERQLSTVQH